jgi:putative transposase
VRRRRKVDVVALVYSLVLGFATGDRRTLAGLRRAYERVTGTCLAPSTFYDRFTPQLASVMKRLLAEVMERINGIVQSAPSVTDRSLRCSYWGRCADPDGGESTTRPKID